MQNPLDPKGRLTAFGTQLIEIHDGLREQLSRLRDEVDDYVDGPPEHPGAPHLSTPSTRTVRTARSLQAHCLAFCSALERHHTQEDDTAFGVLLEHNPDLHPVIDRLRADHHVVSAMLRSIEALVAGLDPDLDTAGRRRARAELQGLAALMESHFGYEERELVTALDALSAGRRGPAGAAPAASPGRPPR